MNTAERNDDELEHDSFGSVKPMHCTLVRNGQGPAVENCALCVTVLIDRQTNIRNLYLAQYHAYISVALNALIKCANSIVLRVRLNASRLTDRSRNSVGSEFQTVGASNRESPTAECNSPTARYSQLMLVD